MSLQSSARHFYHLRISAPSADGTYSPRAGGDQGLWFGRLVLPGEDERLLFRLALPYREPFLPLDKEELRCVARHEFLAKHLESKRLELVASGIRLAFHGERMKETPVSNDDSIGLRDSFGVGDAALVFGEDFAL